MSELIRLGAYRHGSDPKVDEAIHYFPQIEEFIMQSFEEGVNKIIVITGKGLRSKNKENPYLSENLSILKYSVPEFIKTKPNLMKVIKNINYDDVENSSTGSFDIFLKKIKE